MRPMIVVLTLFGMLATAAPAAAAVSAADIVRQSIDGYVRPAYATLHERSAGMSGAMRSLCAQPSAATIEAARAGFAALVEAWSRAEIIRFGPITEQNRLERILFWPDRKGIGLKQVQAALAGRDPDAANPASLAGKSVAMQGLGALEFVLYGTGAEVLADATQPYRCAYGLAVAGNVEAIAGEISAEWKKPDGFAAIWADPGTANPLYRDGTEAVTELLEVFVNGLEMVRDVRVGGFLGETAQQDRPKQALFWRSGNTAAALAANMAGMRDLFAASHLGDALPDDLGWIAQSIRFEFGNAIAAAGAVTGPIDAALADPDRRGRLSYFAVVTTSLSELFGTRLSAAFGLTAGFSSLDGD